MTLKSKRIPGRKRALRDAAGAKIWRRAAGPDAGGRRKAEVALHQVSRLYAVLSRINHFIVRAREPDELFRAICRVAVEVGRFRMAWIGVTDEADAKVKPVAHAGTEDGYLDKMIITADDLPTGKGPTGSSIREGKIMTSFDITTDPKMLPWREEALKRGFRSSAAVPFCRKGKPIGALSLYAAEVGFFTETEQDLLQEIGEEISFALDAMASETERKLAEEALQENEERFRNLSHVATEGIGIHSGGTIIDANKAFANLLGFDDPKDIIGKKGMEIIPFTTESRQRLSDHLRSGSNEIFDIELIGRNGQIITAETSGSDITYQGRTARIVRMRDISDRKRVEEALRASEEKYRSLVDGANEGILVAQDGMLKFVNHRAAEFSGRSEPELMSKPFPEFIYPDDRAMVLDYYMNRMKGDPAPTNYEFRLLTAGGNAKWVAINTVVIDWNGRPAALSFLTDIAERKRTEAALKESEERYRTLFEDATDGIALADAETGRLVECNQALCRMVERDRSELLGQPQSILHPPEPLIGGLTRSFVVHMTSDPEIVSQEEFISKSGRRIPVEIKAARVEMDGRSYLLGVFRDVTERKQAEEALRGSEEKYRSLVDGASETILVAQDGMIKFVNHKAEELSGYSVQNLLAKPFSEFIHPDDRPMVVDNYVKRIKGESVPPRYEFRLLSVDASAKWVEINTVLIDWNGLPATLNFLTDISERKHFEKEKEKLLSQLLQAQKMEAIGALAGGVAHDFNNLLSAISGYTTLAMAKVAESDPLHRDLTQVSNAATRAAGVVRQLLLFSRKHPMELAPVNLNNAVKSLVKMLERVIGEDIAIEFDAGKELWPILGDEGTIEQVLMNLAVNAKDAMPSGGKLSITTENVTVDQEYCRQHSAGRPGRFVCLSIADTGTGMDELVQEHIFEPFFTTKAAGKGTGLGLSVVLGIVQQHEGWIEVRSAPDKGTTFKVYLPRSSARAEQKSREPVPPSSIRGNGERILLVEDHEEVRFLANEILATNGYSVFTASCAKEALALFEKENGTFDLVFTDVGLPDKSGVWLVEELRKHAIIPVLFCSGYTDEKSNWDYIRSKNFRFLRKPFSVPELLAAVKEVLDGKKS